MFPAGPLRSRARVLLFSMAICLLGACGASAPPPPPLAAPTDPALHPALRPRTTWTGLYLQAAKIGWSRTAIETVAPGRHRLVNETWMRIAAMGVVQESTMALTVDFTDQFAPLGYTFSLVTPAFRSEATGEVREGVLVTRLVTPGGERTQEIPLDADADIFGLADLRRAAEGYRVGQVIEGTMFEPNLFGMVPYRIEVLDTQLVKMAGNAVEVWRVKSSIGEISSISIVDATGDLLRSDGPMGIMMKRETEEEARDMGRAGNVTDLIASFSIPAGRDVENPAAIRRAVLAVEGLVGDGYDGGTQSLGPADASGVRLVYVDLDAQPAAVTRDSELDAARRPSSWIQSEDSRVVARMKTVVAGARTPTERVDRIARWVHESMRQEPAFTLPSTVDVLLRMRGDCNEHAALFAGLARAAGVPTRVAAGLVYMQGRFYYHAWNEVHLDGRWVPVDPTFGENPAGALRLRLAVGDLGEQMKIASMAGRLKITIREARER